MYIPPLMPTEAGMTQVGMSQILRTRFSWQTLTAPQFTVKLNLNMKYWEWFLSDFCTLPDRDPLENSCNIGGLKAQLEKNNLASLFLKMHSVLRVSETAIQDIIDNLVQIFSLSKPLVRDAVMMVLEEHNQSIRDVLLAVLVEAIMKTKIFLSTSAEGAKLSTTSPGITN